MFLSLTPEIEEIIIKLKLPIFRKQDTNLTYRALNHYHSKGIIFDERLNKRKWRKLSGINLIWINIIEELREFGMSIDNIFILKQRIFEEGNLGYIDKATFINRSIDQEIALSIYNQYKLFLILFADLTYTFHDSKSVHQLTNKSYLNDPHIYIPLNLKIQAVWKKIVSKTNI